MLRVVDPTIRRPERIALTGRSGAGKTTLLNCLRAAVPACERVVTCEQVFDLAKARSVHRSASATSASPTPWGRPAGSAAV